MNFQSPHYINYDIETQFPDDELYQSPKYGSMTKSQRINIYQKKCKRNNWNESLLKIFDPTIVIFIDYGLINAESDYKFFKSVGKFNQHIMSVRNKKMQEMMLLKESKPALSDCIDAMLVNVDHFITVNLN